MKRFALFLMACILLLTALMQGCTPTQSAAEPESSTPTAVASQTQQGGEAEPVHAALSVSNTLLGFIVPDELDVALCTLKHGFLRTAENLGFPSKLYFAKQGVEAVAAVERAKEEGCAGLLIYSPNDSNQAAIARAHALGLPVVVPYHLAQGEGITANVVTDTGGYCEEVALGIAERMVERECKAGQILVYGYNPAPTFELFKKAVDTYYPQFNVKSFSRTVQDEQAAIDELAMHILWNRDIKGLFAADIDGALIAVRAREKATSLFKSGGAPEKATPTPGNAKPSPSPSATPAPSATPTPAASVTPSAMPSTPTTPHAPGSTPIPEGLTKSIVITVAGYGLTDDKAELMRKNDIYAFVLEPYYDASAQAVMLLDRILSGESVPAQSRLNMPIVRLEVLDKYLLVREQVLDWFKLK